MIRLAWLQSRVQILVAFAALTFVAIVMLVTGPHLHHLYDANVAHCTPGADCDLAREAFLKNDKSLYSWLGGLALVLPAIIGLFWGPPFIARELETGTFRLAWTQSVTRTRWFAIKLAVVGASQMVVAGLFGLLLSWWASPLDLVRADRFSPPLFDERGVVMIGYAAFALMVGVTAGIVIRRTLPAMAVTLVAFVVTKIAVINWIRPRLMAASVKSVGLDPSKMGFGRRNSGPLFLQPEPPRLPDAWVRSLRIVDNAGHALTPNGLQRICPGIDDAVSPPPPIPGSGNGQRTQVPKGVVDAYRTASRRSAPPTTKR